MQVKTIQITVFKIDNEVFDAIGDISQFTSLVWPDNFVGYAYFELWCPITDDNAEMLKKGNVLWTGGENAGVIEIIKSVVDESGEKTFNVKGRTLEKYLEDRILWGGYAYTSTLKSSTIMYNLVKACAIDPTDSKRKIPYLECAEDTFVGNSISGYQKTGGSLYDALSLLASDSDIGYSILFDPNNKKLIFEVRDGEDRTQNNARGNDPVIFSTEFEDILASTYYTNSEDEKTMALVQGEDSGSARVSVSVGVVNGVGFNRKELYVDARDLQSDVYDGSGEASSLTPEEYRATLVTRGDEKLAEHVTTETFEATIRQFGDVQYVYGEDYQKGDKVTIIDDQLGVSTSARITSVEEDFDEEYELILTFGYAYPTLLEKVKRTTI